MKTKLTLKTLNNFGLNTYEAKSYLSLLVKEHLTAGEVAKLSGIPRARIYETLENLLQKGLCRAIPGKVKTYGAVDPIILKDKFNTRFLEAQKELESKRKALTNTKQETEIVIDQLIPLYEKSRSNKDPLDYIDIVKDPLQVHYRACELAANAEKEILVFTKPPFSTSRGQILSQQNKIESQSLKKGVVNKSIYEIPTDPEERKLVIEEVKCAIASGEQAKIVDDLPLKMAIFDEKNVIYFLEDPVLQRLSLTCMIIQHHSLARTLKITFESLWSVAMDVDDFVAREIHA